MKRNARTLAGVHTQTHTGNLVKGKVKIYKASKIDLLNYRFILLAFFGVFKSARNYLKN
mgnify:CR=1 FL=1